MKDPTEILARAKGLLCAELDRRVQNASKRLPHMCANNYRQPLDGRKTVEGVANSNYNRVSLPLASTIGLCMLGSEDPEQWQGTICEDPIDAQKCPYFSSTMTKDQVFNEFLEQTSNPEWLEENMPGVSELLWAAGHSKSVALPFWKRVMMLFTRIKVEPIVRVPDLTPLLTAPKHEDLRS